MFRNVILIVAALMLLVGCGSVAEPNGAAPAAGETSVELHRPSLRLDEVREFRSTRDQRAAEPPERVSIPRIGIESSLTRTGLNQDRTLEVPNYGDISWFEQGTVPGNPGPAALLGHVDSETGPDVFHRLHELNAGDEIYVTTQSGERLTFRVTRIEQHPKNQFPTHEVWMPAGKPELRLITCGGDFNHQQRSYRDNIIAFAELAT